MDELKKAEYDERIRIWYNRDKYKKRIVKDIIFAVLLLIGITFFIFATVYWLLGASLTAAITKGTITTEDAGPIATCAAAIITFFLFPFGVLCVVLQEQLNKLTLLKKDQKADSDKVMELRKELFGSTLFTDSEEAVDKLFETKP